MAPTLRAWLLLLCATAASGSVLTAIPESAAGYIAHTTLLTIADPEGSIVGSISDGDLTISFLSGGAPTLMDVDAVPDSWSTWGSPPNTEGATPMVLAPDDPTQTEIEFLFSSPLTTFGVELEPDDTSNLHIITATYWLGSDLVGTIQRSVSGDAGALLFAGSGGEFDRVDVASDIDFGAAQFRYAPVPEPPRAGWQPPGCSRFSGDGGDRRHRIQLPRRTRTVTRRPLRPLLDGVVNNGTYMVAPSVDTLSEFKLESST